MTIKTLARSACAVFAGVALLFAAPSVASADDIVKGTRDGAYTKSERNKKAPGTPARGSAKRSNGGKSKYIYVPKDEYQQRRKDYQDQAAKITAANNTIAAAQDACANNPQLGACNQTYLGYPGAFYYRQAGGPPGAGPSLPPQTLAYMAVAELRLTAPTPAIGPPPQANRWKMAAVGHPLWLSADGNLDPPTVSNSVLDVSVSLNPRLVKVIFDMGDGEQVTCTDPGRRWTPAVEPGAKSPTCGHTYTEPSLPKGNYTVTATSVWAIHWTINGTTGTLPFTNSASTQIPVGELQVLVR